MPDPSLSTELHRSKITNPKNIREIETIQISQGHLNQFKLDLVFAVDVSHSMNSQIAMIESVLSNVAESVSDDFISVNYGLIIFGKNSSVLLPIQSSLSVFQNTVASLLTLVEPELTPFGELVIKYDWSNAPDLDTGTTFLSETVGFGHGSSSSYMSWTGDDTSDGNEIVTIDLNQAYENEEIATIATVVCAADWYPGAGGSGPATLTMTYRGLPFYGDVIFPPPASAGITPASTVAATVEIPVDPGEQNPEGYGAIVKTKFLTWRNGSKKVLVLLTDSASSEIEANKSTALAQLTNNSIEFIPGFNITDGDYLDLAGSNESVSGSDESDYVESLVSKLEAFFNLTFLPSIFLVNDGYAFDAKTEDDLDVSYLPRAFDIKISGEGTTGVRTINLTIDNTDLQVSRYLANAIKDNLPIEVTYRCYLSNDPEYPQNNPPLKVFLTNVEISGNTVSGELNWIDLSNAAFPNSYYTEDRFPGL
jgi:hypothetical protein